MKNIFIALCMVCGGLTSAFSQCNDGWRGGEILTNQLQAGSLIFEVSQGLIQNVLLEIPCERITFDGTFLIEQDGKFLIRRDDLGIVINGQCIGETAIITIKIPDFCGEFVSEITIGAISIPTPPNFGSGDDDDSDDEDEDSDENEDERQVGRVPVLKQPPNKVLYLRVELNPNFILPEQEINILEIFADIIWSDEGDSLIGDNDLSVRIIDAEGYVDKSYYALNHTGNDITKSRKWGTLTISKLIKGNAILEISVVKNGRNYFAIIPIHRNSPDQVIAVSGPPERNVQYRRILE